MNLSLPRLRRRRARKPIDLRARRASIQLAGSAKQLVDTGRHRMAVTGLLFAVCFAVLAGRLVAVTLLAGGEEPRFARPDRTLTGLAHGPALVNRAAVTDRSGVLLATNLRTASLYANPRDVPDPRGAAARLVRVLPGLGQSVIERRLASNKSFIWLKRNLTPRQQDAVNRLGIPGLNFQTEEHRVYPHGRLAAHVVGFTDVDNNGIAGIEKAFDETLRQPAPGDPALALALDVRVQHALRDELDRAVGLFRPVGAAGLVLDVQTGEVLAMVSLPDFDPNQPGGAPAAARFNRVTLGVYEMGSTFKTFTTAMALDAGVVRMSSGFDASHPLRAARFVIRDFHGQNRWLTVPEIYMYSSNIGAAKMARALGTERQRTYLARLGLLDKPALELPEVGAPLLPRQWHEVETLTIAYGHGLAVSALQLASAVGAVVNGGLMVAPTLIRRPDDQPVVATRVIANRTSGQIRRLMRLVVAQGTGRLAASPGYLVGGKTGTAEKPSAGRYDRNALITSFVAAFPMTAPRWVVLVLLDEPRGTPETGNRATGGLTAAPVAGRVITRIAPILGLDPIDEEAAGVRRALTIKIESRDRKVATF